MSLRRHNSSLSSLALGALLLAACETRGPEPEAQPEPEPDPIRAVVAPAVPSCTCYYSYDGECPVGWSCDADWETFGCARKAPKGGSLAGGCTANPPGAAACTKDSDCPAHQHCINGYCNKQVSPCDGRCVPPGTGSACGVEDTAVVAAGIGLWSKAIMEVATAGGGFLDARYTQESAALGLNPTCELTVKRSTMWIAEMCTGRGLVVHSNTPHEFEEHPIAALSPGECRYDAANQCLNAVIDGLLDPNDSLEAYAEPPASCGGEMPQAPDCFGALDYMGCILDRLEGKIDSLSTKRED